MFGVKLDFSSVTLTGSSDSDSKNYDFVLLKEEFSYFFFIILAFDTKLPVRFIINSEVFLLCKS